MVDGDGTHLALADVEQAVDLWVRCSFKFKLQCPRQQLLSVTLTVGVEVFVPLATHNDLKASKT